jgi:hypothetical protein
MDNAKFVNDEVMEKARQHCFYCPYAQETSEEAWVSNTKIGDNYYHCCKNEKSLFFNNQVCSQRMNPKTENYFNGNPVFSVIARSSINVDSYNLDDLIKEYDESEACEARKILSKNISKAIDMVDRSR